MKYYITRYKGKNSENQVKFNPNLDLFGKKSVSLRMQHKHWGGTRYEDISSNGAPLALFAVAAEEQQEAAVEEVFGGFAGPGQKGGR